ncbi:sigma-70 family RNA polymerase sigma factor [bacterium]|nr:sigma-70 family RNA polymerase sigma factor [bacterium]
MKHPPRFTEETIRALCREHSAALSRFIRSTGVHPDNIDDLIQDCLLTLWIKRNEIQEGKERSFLFGIAHKLTLAYRRKMGLEAKRRAQLINAWPIIVSVQENTTQEHDESMMKRIRAMIKLLPPRLRQVAELIHFAGKTHADVAHELGISMPAVYMADHRAIQRLGQMLMLQSIEIETPEPGSDVS